MMIPRIAFEDDQRAGRLVIAALDGDPLAFDTAMRDAIGDGRPESHPALVFGLVRLAAEAAAALAGSETEAANILRDSLGKLTAQHIAATGENSD